MRSRVITISIFVVVFALGFFIGNSIFADDSPTLAIDSVNVEQPKDTEDIEQNGKDEDTENTQGEIENNNEQEEGTSIEDNDSTSEEGSKNTGNKQKIAHIQERFNSVNIRQGPGTNYSIVSKATKDTVMVILDEQDDWYRVKLEDGTLAWVANWVVDVEE